jgi:UDP-glucuronate 4-epimerase
VKLSAYVEALEAALGKKAIVELLPLQPGDVPDTFSDVSRLQAAVGYKPETNVVEGVRRFVAWYRDYYKV